MPTPGHENCIEYADTNSSYHHTGIMPGCECECCVWIRRPHVRESKQTGAFGLPISDPRAMPGAILNEGDFR